MSPEDLESRGQRLVVLGNVKRHKRGKAASHQKVGLACFKGPGLVFFQEGEFLALADFL